MDFLLLDHIGSHILLLDLLKILKNITIINPLRKIKISYVQDVRSVSLWKKKKIAIKEL